MQVLETKVFDDTKGITRRHRSQKGRFHVLGDRKLLDQTGPVKAHPMSMSDTHIIQQDRQDLMGTKFERSSTAYMVKRL